MDIRLMRRNIVSKFPSQRLKPPCNGSLDRCRSILRTETNPSVMTPAPHWQSLRVKTEGSAGFPFRRPRITVTKLL
jgi:hypothetical protein